MGSKPIPKPVPEVIQENPRPEVTQNGPIGFKVAFIPVKNYATTKEIDLIAKASLKLNETVKSQCFSDFILKAKLKETKGRTNKEVLNHFLGMSDNVPVKIYLKKFTSAIAYRQPPEKTINLNRNYFNESKSPCRWAATMAHESLGHSLGNYGHSYKWNVDREYSVPYKIGGAKKQYGSNAFEECCKD